MRYLKTTLLLLAIGATVNAHASRYVVIKQNMWGRFRYTPVEKPASLSRWYYDDKNDTYYRLKTWMGMSIRMIGPKNKIG